jgi:hypothetical protein
LAELKAQATANPTPPADLKIKTAAEIAAEKEEELKKTNPQLALWNRQGAIALGGRAEVFRQLHERRGSAQAEGLADLCQAAGEIQGTAAQHGRQGSSRQRDPETGRWRRRHDSDSFSRETGSWVVEIEFEGTGKTPYQGTAFMVTFDVEKAKITGLKEEKVAAPVHHTAKKKS